MPIRSEEDGSQRFMDLNEEGHHWLCIIHHSITFHSDYAEVFEEIEFGYFHNSWSQTSVPTHE